MECTGKLCEVSKDWKNKDYILRELGYKEHR